MDCKTNADNSLGSDDSPNILLLHNVSAITDHLLWDIDLLQSLSLITCHGTTSCQMQTRDRT